MKTKTIYLYTVVFIAAALIASCLELNSVSSISGSIKYGSFEDLGCTPDGSLAKINDEVIFNWEYSNNHLSLEFLFSTHCSAECKDSVLISENLIHIYLADTSDYAARCICRLHEKFDFQVFNQSQIRVLFSYKAYASTEFQLLIDQTINL
jgi:hypothetical protein